jgi:hypothetical protein
MNIDTAKSCGKVAAFQFHETSFFHRFKNFLIKGLSNLLDKLILLDVHSLFSTFHKNFP